MPAKSCPFFSRFAGVLFVLSLLEANPAQGIRPDDLAKKYPKVEGIYEMTIPRQGAVAVQVYLKYGTLRTVSAGDADSTRFDPVEGRELRFVTVSPKNRTFQLELLKDEKGRYTRFLVVNEKLNMDVTGVKKADIDDAKADRASSRDRQGYFERHYRKSEHQVPMRDGARLIT